MIKEKQLKRNAHSVDFAKKQVFHGESLIVCPSSMIGYGLGVYTRDVLVKDDLITKVECDEISAEQYKIMKKSKDTRFRYTLSLEGKYYIGKAFLSSGCGLGSFINKTGNNNCKLVSRGNEIWVQIDSYVVPAWSELFLPLNEEETNKMIMKETKLPMRTIPHGIQFADKQVFYGESLIISPSSIAGAGLGVFTRDLLLKDDLITKFECEEIDIYEHNKMKVENNYRLRYALQIDGKIYVGQDKLTPGCGLGSFINTARGSSSSNNCKFVHKKDRSEIWIKVSSNQILAGSELFIPYGTGYHL